MAASKKRGSRPSKYKEKPPVGPFRDTLNLNLNHIITELETMKARNGGKIPYRGITDLVERMKPVLPWLTQNRMRKLNAGKQHENVEQDNSQAPGDSSFWMTNDGTLSTRTHDSTCPPPYNSQNHQSQETLYHATTMQYEGDIGQLEEDISMQLVERTINGNHHGNHEIEEEPNSSGDMAEGSMMESNAIHTKTTVGRPRGTTKAHSRDLKERVRLVTAEAAEKYRIV